MRDRTLLCALLSAALAAETAAQLPPVPVPDGNPPTASKVLLGKALFWDEQLSATRTVACGRCHFPEYGGSDLRSNETPGKNTHPGLDGLFGTEDDVVGSGGVIRNLMDDTYEPDPLFGLDHQVTRRKSPSFINAGYSPTLFWDGRAEGVLVDPLTGQVVLGQLAALESQALEPFVDEVEMGHVGIDWTMVPARIQDLAPLALATDVPAPLAAFLADKTYSQLFAQVFDSPVVTPTRIAMAIASYERELVSDQAPVGNFPNQFTEQEVFGGTIFDTKGRCGLCHFGPLFTDHSFRNTGVRPIAEDLGRGAITGDPADDGKFRVPSLLNVALRGPFFHNGGPRTLEEVIEFYDRGGDFHENLDPDMQPLDLTQVEKDALVAYLKKFTDERVRLALPPFDRPRLYTDSGLKPMPYGAGTAGTGGVIPDAIAIDPPSLTNPEFALGLGDGLGGAQALLLIGTGFQAPGAPLLGVSMYVSLAQPTVLLGAGALGGSGAGNGYGTVVLDLTGLAPTQLGNWFFAQWFVVDPGGPAGVLSASEAIELQIF